MNEKILIVWVISGSKLLSSFLMSAIYTFLKYLHYKLTQASSGNVENLQLWLGSPLHDPFFNPSAAFFGFGSILWEPWG